jgi:hypothetical protein
MGDKMANQSNRRKVRSELPSAGRDEPGAVAACGSPTRDLQPLPETIPACLEFVEQEKPPSYERLVNAVVRMTPDPLEQHPWLIAGDAALAKQTLSDRIRELLEILWADLEFWELVNFGPSTFSAADIVDLRSFAAKIKPRSDRVSTHLNSQFSTTDREVLLKHAGSGPDFILQQFLADKLNQIIQTGPLYEKKRFSGVKLSPGTRDMIAQNPVGAALSRLNRCLLKDAYPSDL